MWQRERRLCAALQAANEAPERLRELVARGVDSIRMLDSKEQHLPHGARCCVYFQRK
jgi:aryl carrier-like protein